MPTPVLIKFACPNGHPLSCPREMIGKPGKCPKCNTKFVVPDIPDDDEEPAEEPAPHESGTGFKIDTTPPAHRGKPAAAPAPIAPAPLSFAPAAPAAGGSSKTTGGEAGKVTAAGSGIPAGGDVIVFLCPNGHRLNGPKKLQGKPGQCPHCGAKFVIPLDEPEESSAEGEVEPPVSRRASDSTEVDPQDLDQLEEVEEAPADSEWPGGDPSLAENVADLGADDIIPELTIPPPPAGSHPLATLLARLWQQASAGRRVQIELDGGETITPEFYCREYSYTGYAVFAVRLDDGTHTVISVPWDKVSRITVRGVKELPEGLFE